MTATATRDPARHVGLIWFTVWSSVAHGTVMAVHSVTDPGQMGHLWGDVAALYLTAVLAVLVYRELPGVSLTGRGGASQGPEAPTAGARA